MEAEKKWCVLGGNLQEFTAEYETFKSKNKIIEKHISSQIVQVPNPNFIKGVTDRTQPEIVTTVYISAVIQFEPVVQKLEITK